MPYAPSTRFSQDDTSTSTAPPLRSVPTSDRHPATKQPQEQEQNVDPTLSVPEREVCRCIHLAGRPAAVRYAREAIQHELRSLGLEGADESIQECAESVLLIVSELVTNACRHSPGPADLRTTWHDHTLTVEVDDYGEDMPVVVDSEDRGSSGGFGMSLVETLSDGWGVESQDEGKTVYAHVTFP